MDATPDRPDGTATPSPDEDDLSVRVTLAKQDGRAWLRLKGATLTVELPESAMGFASTGMLALDIALGVVGALAAGQTDSFTVDAEEVIVLPPRRRLTGGQLMGLIPALLFGFVAVVLTIVALADPHQSDLGLAAAFWALALISLAPALPFLLRGRRTARIRLGTTGPLIEFWYRPGCRKHRALDAFFVRLLQAQELVGDAGVAAVPFLWRDTPWESLDAPEEGTPYVRWFVLGVVAAAIVVGMVGLALHLTGIAFLALLGLIVLVVVLAVVVRCLRTGEMRKAERLWDGAKYDAAADTLCRLLARRPRHEPAWRMFVEYCVGRRDFRAALACCDAMQAHGLAIAAQIREAVARFSRPNEGCPSVETTATAQPRGDARLSVG